MELASIITTIAGIAKPTLSAIAKPAAEKLARREAVIGLLEKCGFIPDHPPSEFEAVYNFTLVEYGVWKQRSALELFRNADIRDIFRQAFQAYDLALLVSEVDRFLSENLDLSDRLQEEFVDVRKELDEFAFLFMQTTDWTRTPKEVVLDRRVQSLQRDTQSLLQRTEETLNRLNRLESPQARRTEWGRLSAGEDNVFALSQQMKGWFETLGYPFEKHEVWGENSFEWILKVPVRRGRFDRVLVKGVSGIVKAEHVLSLREATDALKVQEGWLIAAQRISPGAREEVKQHDGLLCYTFDEMLDLDADFSGYLERLTKDIQDRGIDRKYVSLACTTDEINPKTQQKLRVSRYENIDSYIDTWLEEPSKEHVSVLGEFGTGKTWFALHYAWEALQKYQKAKKEGRSRPRLPLVVPLRDYAKAISVRSLFSEFFFDKHEILVPGYSAFEQLNRMGKLLLIFDGFDEMAARVDRQATIDNFWELAKAVVPGSKVILTCRTEHFSEAQQGRELLNAELKSSVENLTGEAPQFEILELEKFDDERIRQVLSFATEPETIERIMGDPQLRDLARRPVMIDLIVEALPGIKGKEKIDMSRIYLYAVRQKMERDIKQERTFTSMADKLYFLCEIAWEMLSSERMKLN